MRVGMMHPSRPGGKGKRGLESRGAAGFRWRAA